MSSTSTSIINKLAVNNVPNCLTEDLQSKDNFPNRDTRAVRHGHFVSTKPEPLSGPFLIAYSSSMLNAIGLNRHNFEAADTVDLFSGKLERLSFQSWATPYAVSVNGNPILSPDNASGYAYGDGRAMTIFEVNGFEVQLKGSGRTPFSRNFDGRAVLRSSIWEFLVSELMSSLGVPTTRALTLISSFDKSDFVSRPWYKGHNPYEDDDIDFQFPPNRMIQERCAIASRATSSFFRIGHVELFSRRVRNGDPNEAPLALKQLSSLVKFVIARQFPQVNFLEKEELTIEVLLNFLTAFAEREAFLVCEWERVGFVQGNMNSDNMLLNGCTLDYGPFGFMEKFDPLWNPFTSDPQKNYGFLNQARASHFNFATLVDAIIPLSNSIDSGSKQLFIDLIRDHYPAVLKSKRFEMRRKKLGLLKYDENIEKTLYVPLLKFLNHFDYTIFWRTLSLFNQSYSGLTNQDLIEPLQEACYDDFLSSPGNVETVCVWLKTWLNYCLMQEEKSGHKLQLPDKATMEKANPKYIAREWMLVEAYSEAKSFNISNNNYHELLQQVRPSLGQNSELGLKELWENKNDIPFAKIYALQKLFSTPYAEHKNVEDLFYIKTPEKYRNKPGTAFYS